MSKKAYDISGLTDEEKARLNLSPNKTQYLGIRGDHLLEPYILPEKQAHEVRMQGMNGQLISMIRDTPGDIGSGLSGRTGAGSIELVAGFSSADPSRTTVENPQRSMQPTLLSGVRDYKGDAARIVISQKTNVDDNYELVDGTIGNIRNKSAVSMKADSIRLVAREGIKIVTGATEDEKNSRGEEIRSVPRINLIAGNTASELQPLPLARSMDVIIKDLYQQITNLNSTLDTFMTTQIEFNTAVITHTHTDIPLLAIGLMSGTPINQAQTLPSNDLIAKGMKTMPTNVVSKLDSVFGKLQMGISDFNASNEFGPKNAASPSIFAS